MVHIAFDWYRHYTKVVTRVDRGVEIQLGKLLVTIWW